MNIRDITTLIGSHNLFSLNRIMGDLHALLRMQFLYAAVESGLLEALRTPATRDELVHQLAVKRPEILDALLDVGLALKELSYQDTRYRIIGKRSLSLQERNGDTFAAIVQASVTYYNSVFLRATDRMRGAPSGHYLEEIGGIVARASRLTEPFVCGFVRDLVKGKGALRFLDIGCGSGIALQTARAANPHVTGIGIDMDRASVRQARDNLDAWGIGKHFEIIAGDIRFPPARFAGYFDVIHLASIVYYFTVEERLALFQSLHAMLTPGGTIAIASTMQGNGTDAAAATLNLATSSMVGCTPLPGLDDLTAQLQESGFGNTHISRLIPGAAFYGITARRD